VPEARDRAGRPASLRGRREFEQVALVHQARLYHLALALCRNRPDAEDLVQETLFRAFRRFDRFMPGTNCLAWLATILRNLFINQVTRHRGVIVVGDESALEKHAVANWTRGGPAAPSPEDEFLGSVIDDRRLLAGLVRLSRAQREVIFLAAVEGLSYGEIALRARVPIGTVMSRLFRARRRLLKALASGTGTAPSDGETGDECRWPPRTSPVGSGQVTLPPMTNARRGIRRFHTGLSPEFSPRCGNS
jgi:RNA polymerase sigma-70 factor (ECF subfamily)